MRIIGIDQSSTSTGVSIFNDDELLNYVLIEPKVSKKVNYTVVEYSPHLYEIKMTEDDYGTTLLRITETVDVLEAILQKEKPDVVYFEEIYAARNIAGFRSLARLQGFIAHLCHKLKIHYVIVEENKWINVLGNYSFKISRSERKADIMKKMNDRYGLDIKKDDITDAIAIGTYACIKEKENK